MDVTISAKAYCKLILHAAKYPHCAVNGVLVAKQVNKTVEFVDAFPLFHISLNLTPMAEIALSQIDTVAADDGLLIAGYYTANENLEDNSLEKYQHRIADMVAQHYPAACFVLIDNKSLGFSMENIAIKVAQFQDGKYQPIDVNKKVKLVPEETMKACGTMLYNNVCSRLVDFDNHLDDVSLDWMNKELNKEIEQVVNNY